MAIPELRVRLEFLKRLESRVTSTHRGNENVGMCDVRAVLSDVTILYGCPYTGGVDDGEPPRCQIVAAVRPRTASREAMA